MSNLSISQMLTGLLITLWGVYPTLTECWPYGKVMCQVQAVIRGSLRQNSALTLVLIAFERYVAQVDMDMYNILFSKPLTVLYIVLIWLISLSIFVVIVFPYHGFFLSITSFSVCEPHYHSLRMLVFSSCTFYFSTTMVLMYCYGTIYHSQKLKMKNRKALFSALPLMIGSSLASQPVRFSEEAENVSSLVRSLSAISMSFIILVTPWSILQVITSVTMEQVTKVNNNVLPTKSSLQPPPSLDFTVNLLFSCSHLLCPLLFWLLNPVIRRAMDRSLYQAVSNRYNLLSVNRYDISFIN